MKFIVPPPQVLTVLILLLSFSGANAQPISFVNKVWEYNHSAPDTVDWSASATDGTGKLITTGNTLVNGQYANLLVTKYDQSGSIMWQKDWDGNLSKSDYGAAIITDDNNNIYVAGASQYSNDSIFDIVLLKYNPQGVKQWETNYDRTGGTDYPSEIIMDQNGNIFITGTSEGINSEHDFITLKYDNNATLQWAKSYDYSQNTDIAADIIIENGGGEIIVTGGSETSQGVWDYTTISYDDSGNEQSVHREPSDESDLKKPKDIVKDDDLNYYITGIQDNGSDKDIKVLKLDSTLQPEWVEVYDQADEGSNTIAGDDDGNVYVGGWLQEDGIRKFFLLKYNASGNVQWNQVLLPDPNKTIAEITDIKINSHGFISVTGFTTDGINSDIVTAQYEPQGELNWVRIWKNYAGSIETPTDIETVGNDIYVSGRTTDSSGSIHWSTIKYSIFNKDQPIVYCDSTPCAVDDEVLIRFNPDDLILSNVDNKDKRWGYVGDFVKASAITSINAHTEFDLGKLKCYKIHPGFTSEDTTNVSRTGDIENLPPLYATFGMVLPNQTDDSLAVQYLNNAVPNVLIATINGYAQLTAGANDPEYNNGNSAGLHSTTAIPDANINIEGAWDFATGDPSVTVGVFDTGIHNKHGDLSNGTFASSSVSGGFDYVNNLTITSVTNPDGVGHGTAVSGIISGWRNNSFGVAGVAGGSGSGGASLNDMKIFKLDSGCGTVSATASQIQQAIFEGVAGTPNVSAQDIMNHSWSGPFNPLIREAFISSYNFGVISIAASGNGFTSPPNPCNSITFPASFKDHILMKVGANDDSGTRASFSKCGWGLDFIAPGTHDLYTGLDNSGSGFTDSTQHPNPNCPDKALDGTSFAAPHASGVVALMLSYFKNNIPAPNNQLAPEDCEELIQRNATDLTAPPNLPGYDDETGWGRINASQLFDSIKYPQFLVLHKKYNVPTNTAIQVGSQESTCLERSMYGLPVGEVKVNRFEISASNSHVLPSGQNIISGWSRGSASSIAGINSGFVGNCIPTCFACDYIPDAPNPKLEISTLTQTGVDMKGYIYEILDSNNNPVGWWPHDTSTVATFAYSLYVENGTVSIKEDNSLEFKLFPNPAKNKVKLQVGKSLAGKTTVLITDMLGEKIKVINKQNINSEQPFAFSIDNLPQGCYLVSIRNDDIKKTKLLVKK